VKEFVRLTEENFVNQELQGYSGKILVFFSADWCPYCISFFNNWKEYGKVKNPLIADVTDADSDLWDDFQLSVVPSMAIFLDGKLEKLWNGSPMIGLTLYQIEEVNLFFSEL